jgi:cell wall-associated NlpC family hydrolase
VALAGCSGARPKRYDVKPVPGKVILREAKAQIGVPYRYGGADPKKGFDCSGLVWWCYRQHGSSTPRTARELFKVGDEVRTSDLEPGDLVFFDTARGSKPGHVGIYSGDGRFVHAPASRGKVREDELINNYWRKAWYGARRIR